MSDNGEFEFFKKSSNTKINGLAPADSRGPAHPATILAFLAPASLGVLFLWVALSGHNSNNSVTQSVHPYYKQKSIITPLEKNPKNIEENVGLSNGSFSDKESDLIKKAIGAESIKSSPFIGNLDNVSKDDLQKMEEFSRKMRDNSVSRSDLEKSVNTLNKIQSDYYNKPTN